VTILLDIRELPISNPVSGHRRVPISLLPLLARTLGVTLKAGRPHIAPPNADRHRSCNNSSNASLPKAQQRFVMQMIDTVLQQQQASR